MTPAQFLETRSGAWDRLEALTAKAGRRGAGVLSGGELHELTRLYPAVTVDVARARMLEIDPQTQRRINALAIAAHGLLYRRRHVRPLRAIGRFLRREYPQLFRRLWPYVVLSVTIFAGAAAAAYVTTRIRPAAARLFAPGALDAAGTGDEVSDEDVSERYRHIPKAMMTSFITTNNIRVAFLAFALGIVAAGLGTGYVLLLNGMMLGAFFGHFANHNLTYVCFSFITPHGVLEIFAILVAGGAGLRLGLSLAVPGGRTRGASLRAGAKEAVLLVLGTIPMFIVAGAVESFITPSYLPGGAKIALGVLLGAAALAYLLAAGHSRRVALISR